LPRTLLPGGSLIDMLRGASSGVFSVSSVM
jgi:hypothetical protein